MDLFLDKVKNEKSLVYNKIGRWLAIINKINKLVLFFL
jgi:hypothetical protein